MKKKSKLHNNITSYNEILLHHLMGGFGWVIIFPDLLTGEQTIDYYQCDYCPTEYDNIPSLQRHIKKSHKEVKVPRLDYFTKQIKKKQAEKIKTDKLFNTDTIAGANEAFDKWLNSQRYSKKK